MTKNLNEARSWLEVALEESSSTANAVEVASVYALAAIAEQLNRIATALEEAQERSDEC